jgi:hypothetical protein
VWAIAAQSKVENFANPSTPSGAKVFPLHRRDDLAHPDLAQLLNATTEPLPAGGTVMP